MGKTGDNAEAQAENDEENVGGSNASRVWQGSTLKWIVAVILSVNLLVFGVSSLWEYCKGNRQHGQDAIGNTEAQAQASFMIHRPFLTINASLLKLESDIWEEVGISNVKVTIISLKPLAELNWTQVVFGVVPNLENSSISLAGLSVLRAVFVDLVLEKYNLSLTPDIFGRGYFFQVLKFPEGITVVPDQSSYPLQYMQVLFNFSLHNSIVRVGRNLAQLKEQLKIGLHVRPNENLFVQLTNLRGSTIEPPIIVQTSIMPVVGKGLTTPRLKQLAQEISGSHARNLGLNHTLFGKVKKIKLSSFLKYKSSSPSYVPSQALPPSHPPFRSPLAAPISNPSPVPSALHNYGHPAMPPSRYHAVGPSGHNPLAHRHHHHSVASSNCRDQIRHPSVSGLNGAPSSFSSHTMLPRNRPCIHYHHGEAASAPLSMLLPPHALSPQNIPHFKTQPCHCHLPSPPPSSSGSQLMPYPSPVSSQAASHTGDSSSESHRTGDQSISSTPASSPKSSDATTVNLARVQPPESRLPHAEVAAPVSPCSH